MHPLLEKEHTGVLLPLFSLRSKKDWGIGDISSMALWVDALADIKLDLLQLLPVNEMPPGVTCPYTALSAFALDPVYIAVEDIPELAEYADITAEIKSKKIQTRLRHLRASPIVQYDDIKRLKYEFLWKLYCRFHEHHILQNSSQAKEFFAFTDRNAYWLDDYALFRQLKETHSWASWTRWEASLMRHDAAALKDFESANENQVLFFKYLQWIIDRQWRRTKEKAVSRGVHLLGDLPFMVNQESADVWARQNDFDITREIGAPPDAFSDTGQKWGLPAYNWPEVEKNNFEWWRLKVKKSSEFYDLFRIDHMVGFFRTWLIPRDVSLKPDFDIKDENAQRERGKKFLQAICGASPMLPVAEDLGVIPPFVPGVLAELNVPGYKVMRWEKQKGGYYARPESYDRVSLATSSTHDNEPLADWWRTVDPVEKKLLWLMVSGKSGMPPAFSKARETILRSLLKAASCLIIIPAQDIFGFRDRINSPGTMGIHNWTYKFPAPVENLFKKYGELLKAFSAMVIEERK
ncbi:MAG: 4-alpha-glucanotransferase [Elusimicrobia bacterium]|nr:4-alpha-glucanotransferase [Elusimicrobiota bacterium]